MSYACTWNPQHGRRIESNGNDPMSRKKHHDTNVHAGRPWRVISQPTRNGEHIMQHVRLRWTHRTP